MPISNLATSLVGGAGGSIVGRAVVQIVGDTTALEKDLARAKGQTASATGSMGASTSKFAGAAKAAYIGLGVALAAYVVKSIQSAAELQKVEAQTAATLKSTGASAWTSATQIRERANALEQLSSVDDMAIQTGQNLLLTFTRIRNEVGEGNDIFNQAEMAMLDMSVALGKDMTGSAIMLGKALNDPVKGVTALRRVGVSFTAEQEQTIKTLANTNRLLDAQKLILEELRVEFGGSAEALGQTLTGQFTLFGDAVMDAGRDLAMSLLPALTSLVQVLGGAVKVLTPLLPLAVKVLGAFLAYKALTFLAPLLMQVGVAMASVNTSMVAGLGVIPAAGRALQAFSGHLPGIAAAATIVVPAITRMFDELGRVGEIEREAREQLRLTEDQVYGIRAAVYEWYQANELLPPSLGAINEGAEGITAILADFESAALATGMSQKDVRAIFVENWGQIINAVSKGEEAVLRLLRSLLGVSREAVVTQEALSQDLDAVTPILQRNRSAIDSWAGATGSSFEEFRSGLRDAMAKGTKEVVKFTSDTAAAITEWHAEVADRFNGVASSLDDLASKNHLTADKIIAEFGRQLRAQQDYADNLDAVVRRGGDAADGLVAHLSEMGLEGAGIVEALAGANDRQFKRILRMWEDGEEGAQSLADTLADALVVGFTKVINKVLTALGLPTIKFNVDADTSKAENNLKDFFAGWERVGVDLGFGFAQRTHSGGRIPEGMEPRDPRQPLGPDEVVSVLKKGEFVVREEATRRRGVLPLLEQINRMQVRDYHVGGRVTGKEGLENVARGIGNMDDLIRGLVLTWTPDWDVKDIFGFAPGAVGGAVAGATPAIATIFNAVMSVFPDIISFGIKNIRTIAGTNTWSQHAYGNAWDASRPGWPASLDPVWAWLQVAAAGGLPVNIDYSLFRETGGGSPHLDHIHIAGDPLWGGDPHTGGYPLFARGGMFREGSRGGLAHVGGGEPVLAVDDQRTVKALSQALTEALSRVAGLGGPGAQERLAEAATGPLRRALEGLEGNVEVSVYVDSERVHRARQRKQLLRGRRGG